MNQPKFIDAKIVKIDDTARHIISPCKYFDKIMRDLKVIKFMLLVTAALVYFLLGRALLTCD